NRLLWLDPTVDGVKTGHTSSAGYCLVTSAKREQGRMIAVVLGAKAEKDRVSASQALLNYGFSFYTTRLMHEAGVALAEPRVWLGDAEKLPLGLAEPLGVTVPKGKAEGLKSEIQVDPQIEAPVGRGSVHGKVVVTLDGNTVAEAPLVALQDVAEGSFFSRLLDHILMLFHKLIG
ncbi:MAG TPA: serine-type D-Ala-D-Ala carboxypeptidase, partial [Plasticicumulans sp.]|nr:serine-type D-Ala-D-Ala carboxypeptidase [Plasticicumulans sp.]